MAFDKQIELRLKTLKFNLQDLNDSFEETLKDTVLECGLEYNKSYPYNKETLKIIAKFEELKKYRKERLFCYIFNFSQTFYSIKEYLRELHPQKERIIEDFFSNEKIEQIARKDISNNLKHKPEKDLKYDFRQVSKEVILEPIKETERIEISFCNTWFYEGIDSVKHCNVLFEDLQAFLKNHFTETNEYTNV